MFKKVAEIYRKQFGIPSLVFLYHHAVTSADTATFILHNKDTAKEHNKDTAKEHEQVSQVSQEVVSAASGSIVKSMEMLMSSFPEPNVYFSFRGALLSHHQSMDMFRASNTFMYQVKSKCLPCVGFFDTDYAPSHKHCEE